MWWRSFPRLSGGREAQDLLAGQRQPRNIARRLKNRANTAYAQIRDVESFANLRTCRREHLLRHFGDMEEVAPCAGCDVCLGETEELSRAAGPRTGIPEEKQPLVSAFAGSSPVRRSSRRPGAFRAAEELEG